MTSPQAPDSIVSALVSEGLVAPGDAERATAVVTGVLGGSSPVASSLKGRLVEIAAYVGGALVFAAGFLFLLDQWDDLTEGARVVAVAFIAALLAGAGLVIALYPFDRADGGFAELEDEANDVRRRLVGALLTGSALATCFAAGLLTDNLTEGFGEEPGMVASFVLVVGAAVAYAVVPTALGQLAMAGGAFSAAYVAVELIATTSDTGPWIGLLQVALAAGWLAMAETGVFRERLVARILGATWLLVGAQLPLGSNDVAWLAYLLTALVAAAAVGLYLSKLSWPYIALAVVAVTLVVPEAIIDWSNGSLGPAGGVLVAGLTLLGASFAGFKVREEVTD